MRERGRRDGGKGWKEKEEGEKRGREGEEHNTGSSN